MNELGAGAKPIPRKRLTAAGLADAINAALTPAVKAAANDLGAKIRSERGAETAARIIDGCLHQRGATQTPG